MNNVDPVIGYVSFRRTDLRKIFFFMVAANLLAKSIYTYMELVSEELNRKQNTKQGE